MAKKDKNKSTGAQYPNPDFVLRSKTHKHGSHCAFHPPYNTGESYLYSSTRSLEFHDFASDFEPLVEYFDLLTPDASPLRPDDTYARSRRDSERRGAFVINQGNYSWFGWGFDNFLTACANQEERYAEINDLEGRHHSESAFYMYSGNGAKLMIYGQPYAREKDYIRYGGITLLTHGAPTKRDFIDLLDAVPASMSNGLSWDPVVIDWWNGRSGYGPYTVPEALNNLDPQSGTAIAKSDGDLRGYLCENPYYRNPQRLLTELGYDYETVTSDQSKHEEKIQTLAEKFTNVEKILLRSAFDHKVTDDTSYTFERFRLGEIPSIDGAGVGMTADIKIKPQKYV